MTAAETLPTAGAGAPAAAALWRGELGETMKLATPLAVTQLGQIAMMTTDLALLGRLGDHVVAATALAHTVLFIAFTLGVGLVSAVAPLASQAFGARNPRFVRRSLRVGLWAAVLAGVPLTALQFWGEDILLALGQAPQSAELAGRYLMGLCWCLVPAWAFIALRNFMSAVNRPEPALWITLAAIPLNGVLAYALIYGAFGMPRLDVLGAGLATTLVNTLHVRGRHLGRLHAPSVQEVSACSAASGGSTGSCSSSCSSSACRSRAPFCSSSVCLPPPRC